MEPTITLFSVVMLLGAAHGLFLALALINAKVGNILAHRFLALLILAFAFDLGLEFLYQSRYLLLAPKLIYLQETVGFLYGPLTYLYVSTLTSRTAFLFPRMKWIHFLPFAMSFVLLLPLYALNDSVLVTLLYSESEMDGTLGGWPDVSAFLIEILPLFLIGFYLILSLRKLFRHARVIRDQFSSIGRISLTWLRSLLIALCMLYVIYLFGVFFSDQFGIAKETKDFLYVMIVIAIYTMGYLGLRQPAIFSYLPAATDAVQTESPQSTDEIESENIFSKQKRKYERSALDDEMSTALLSELQSHMSAAKPYLDSALTLADLAKQLGISSNYLSQVINEQLDKNFFDFINYYRVEEAKLLLSDPAQAGSSIVSIAMEAGFNSKSAFYTAFKKHTGITPSQARRSLSD
jgi:AraC-like DNA-binding protein